MTLFGLRAGLERSGQYRAAKGSTCPLRFEHHRAAQRINLFTNFCKKQGSTGLNLVTNCCSTQESTAWVKPLLTIVHPT